MKINIAGRGVVAGLMGGAMLAVWFLIVDAIAGQAFRTPGFLAAALLGLDQVIITGGMVALYSAIHFGVFALVGVATAVVLRRAPISPNVMWGAGLGLLLFTSMFYLSLIIGGASIVHALGWPQVLIGSILAGVAIVGTLSLSSPSGPFPLLLHGLDRHEIVREGLRVGLVGAIVVIAWMHLVDLVQVRPFFTPGALGSALFLGADTLGDVRVDWVVVLAYTFVHFAAFLVTGIIASAFAAQAEKTPAFLLAGILLFVAFEAFFMGFTAIMAEFLLGALAWWTIAAGNILAAGTMGFLLLRLHPRLRAPEWGDGTESLHIPLSAAKRRRAAAE